MIEHLTFGLFLLIYFFLHSLLANATVKSKLQKKLIPEQVYRLFYNITSLLLLLPMAYLFSASENKILFDSVWPLKVVATLLIVFGLYLWKITFKRYSLSEFMGFDLKRSSDKGGGELSVGGLNQWVRHPLYSISYLVLLGLFLMYPHPFIIILIITISIYLPIGIYFEERKLVVEFGNKYVNYRQITPALFPNIQRVLGQIWKKNPKQ
jgi:protein-S-isoprenylcysteine O-methyltransferase Ste14